MRTRPEGSARSRRGIACILAAVVVLSAVVVVTLIALRYKTGAAAPREAVSLFVTAAADRNRAETLRFVRNDEHPIDVETAFALVPAGARAEQIDVQKPFGDDIAFADVRGAVEGRSWNARFTMTLNGGRWYVAVGEAPDPRPKSSTTRPR